MKKIIIAIIATVFAFSAKCQVFFHRIDINTGNIYTFVASNLVSAGLNQLTKDRLADTSFEYTFYSKDSGSGQLDIKDYNRAGITVKDLFADCNFGTRLGYRASIPVFSIGQFMALHTTVSTNSSSGNPTICSGRTSTDSNSAGVYCSVSAISSKLHE